MKKTLNILAVLILLLAAPGCTRPDGDIGVWFGSWHLESIMIDGVSEQSYADNPEIMFNFQGKVFNAAYMERAEIYGEWSYAGETLTLIASFQAGSGANLSYLFDPFPVAMHFPQGVDQLEITVTRLTSDIMQWQYTDQYGRMLTYNFRKYP
ncbi:MAG: hypothetical protein J1F07_02350 [Muribaculaceae bacterium]|nr:hypothetical protein [Muribaculaceae bacterium]